MSKAKPNSKWILIQPKSPFRKSSPLEVENLEAREVPAASFDGTGNNIAHPTWGSDNTALIRVAPPAYADGASAPTVGAPARPSARLVSNTIVDQGSADSVNDRQMAAMVYAWGQFIDHDLDLTNAASPAESFNIAVPKGDPSFDPNGTGTQVIPLTRSQYTTVNGVRQQINTISAFLDGSMVYGSDQATADKLRSGQGGRMKTSAGDLLPLNNAATFPTGTLPMANAGPTPSSQLFAAGDVRANENVELTSMQTLFVREHNRLADRIRQGNPRLSDEQIYQQARALVIGEIQSITYNEWLPALLGREAMAPYRGYDPRVNPGIANEFSTAAFRFGHSLLGDDVKFLDNNGQSVRDQIALSQAFFNPNLVKQTGIDPILKYLSSDPSSELDTKVVDSLRNFLFGPPGSGGLDLASLNIQRGRDHGLADYNTTRAAYGLPKVHSFADITKNVDVQNKLRSLYTNVDNIDLWVGLLAEDHVPGGSVGQLTGRIIGDQFERLRAGDRFFFENQFSGPVLRDLETTKLADVIRRNTGLTNLQQNVFFFRVAVSGQVFDDRDANGRHDPNERGLAGRTIELVDATSGTVVGTTTTDERGNYRVDIFDGLGTGQYKVREVVPTGWTQTTRDAGVIQVTRGDTFVDGIDFGVHRNHPTPAAIDMVFGNIGAMPTRPPEGMPPPPPMTGPNHQPTAPGQGSSQTGGASRPSGVSTSSTPTESGPLDGALSPPRMNPLP